MSWRTVVITDICKLDYSMNYMVIRGKETKRVLLDEIAMLIIENNAVSFTGCLMSELINKKVKVIICDNKRNPQAELLPYYGAHNDSLRIRQQMAWDENIKTRVWTRIVKEKIFNQADLLARNDKIREANMLYDYADQILPGDVTNREGHAAKVYFNALFGLEFTRGDENIIVNSALNYGYSLILSAVNREIVSSGYLTQLGLFHENQFNHFNLSSDLMEPLRIIVDEHVLNNESISFSTLEKHGLISVLNKTYMVNKSEYGLLNAIKIYIQSVFAALNNGSEELINFVEL